MSCAILISVSCHADVNECRAGTHSCDHNCHNTPGSYGCSCFHGYKLRADMRNCEGKFFVFLILSCRKIKLVKGPLRLIKKGNSVWGWEDQFKKVSVDGVLSASRFCLS